jgi:hypothetical protein
MKRASHRRRAAPSSSAVIVAILPISPAHAALRGIVQALAASLAGANGHKEFDGARGEDDLIDAFLSDRIDRVAGDRIQASKLADAFAEWAKARGAPPWSCRRLAIALKKRGLRSKHSGVNWWLDVTLRRGIKNAAESECRPWKKTRAVRK